MLSKSFFHGFNCVFCNIGLHVDKGNTIPEYFRSGFILVRTSSIVLTSWVIPMAGRYCSCTGIRI